MTTTNLEKKYTLDNFVAGPGNELSYYLARVVSRNPGKEHSLVYFHGLGGIGKTHLLQGIAREIPQRFNSLVVRYMSLEQFTNALIKALRDDKIAEFRLEIRSTDVLLIDNIEFLQGKMSTQEEFLFTFDEMRSNGKQIVIAGELPPESLFNTRSTLRSRFDWGVVSELQMPDVDTKLLILRRLADASNADIGEDALRIIAAAVEGDIRKLEGVFHKAQAYAPMRNNVLR
ncbi:MAG: AAA family ATPase [Candidatus Obscuribacterales bacterium]|nr:AAA family ATPase [Candidatus Obscuribacterales bacterium]